MGTLLQTTTQPPKMLVSSNGLRRQARLPSAIAILKNLKCVTIFIYASSSIVLSACAVPAAEPGVLSQPVPLAVDRQRTVSSLSSAETFEVQHAEAQEATVADRHVTTSWKTSINPAFAKAKRLVEEELSVDLSDISLEVQNSQSIDNAVAQETQRLVKQQFGQTRFARAFMDTVMSAQAGTYAALYSADQQAVLVSESMLTNYENSLPDDAELRAQALLTLLIHELVHAADDQRYNIHENRALNFRASFAQSATFEGHAQWVTRRICTQENCLPGLKALDSFMFSPHGTSKQLTQPVEAISRNVLEYSYVEGERFVEALSNRSNGQELIQQLLAKPPTDPVQILEPESYPNVVREQLNQHLLAASRSVNHEWAGEDWIGVETSPLKGVNLRDDPERRQAAIDGFTRLITAMVATQYYNQNLLHSVPVEVILIQAESTPTAKLFTTTLHQNSLTFDTQSSIESFPLASISLATESPGQIDLYRSRLPGESGKSAFQTVVANLGPYVVQINGTAAREGQFSDFARQVLYKLQTEAQTQPDT